MAQGAEAAAWLPGRGGGARRLQAGERGEQCAVAVGHALGQRLRQLQRAQAQQRQRLGRRQPVRSHVLRRRVALRTRVCDRVSACARFSPGLRPRVYKAALPAAGQRLPGRRLRESAATASETGTRAGPVGARARQPALLA